jgi:hypothetical protein
MRRYMRVLVTVLMMTVILNALVPVSTAGWVFSLHPIADDRNSYFAPHLLGKWEVKALLTSGKVNFDFEESEFAVLCEIEEKNRGYEITLSFGDDLELEFDARLARYWGETWLELKPSEDSLVEFIGEDSIHPLLVVELYYFFKVEEMGKELVLSIMDPVWALERLQTVSRHMKFALREFESGVERIYLTSEPHEVRAFLARASRFQEALPYAIKLVRSEDRKK